VYGLENVPDNGPLLLVCNHQSYLDPLFCGSRVKRNLCFMARDSLFAPRFLGGLLLSLGVTPVSRGKADIAMTKRIISTLRQGNAVCLFPEGTRTSDGKIAELKAGFGLIARRGEAAIVPVVIDGGFECWPRHQKLFSLGSRITVCYGKAITAERVKAMKNRQLAAVMTDTLRKMQTQCRVMNGKKGYNYDEQPAESS